ncbi:hypothetical protein OIU76_025183 [Salix suchowensis]|nr:hypothetical protein OIU76_025183 [Salix suchowensis]
MVFKGNSVGSIYHREDLFLPNYATMENDFKVFVYPGRDPTTCYDPRDKLKRKYPGEHYFLKNLIPSWLFTDDPTVAHLFLIPLSFAMKMKKFRPSLMKNVNRLICSPSYDSENLLQLARSTVKSRPLMIHPEMMLPRRTKLGFWACSLNSDVRKNLLIFYKGAPEFNFHFIDKMKRAAILDAYENELYGSKFCICPRWNNHLGGVCLTESMTFGCVPVILSDYYDLPFNDVLDWNNFSVILKEEHVPNLEKILKEIPEENYKKMHQNLLQVRKHFQWNSLPVKYDLFRMVMYELWLRRHIIKYDEYDELHMVMYELWQRRHIIRSFRATVNCQVSLTFRALQDSHHFTEALHSPEVFEKDYMDMERNFKIFMYPYTDKDVVDDKQWRLIGKYGSEGYFFENLRQGHFLTQDPDKRLIFSSFPFLVISCVERTLGADHFFVTCHDVGVTVTERMPHLMKNMIRVVCSPSYYFQNVPRKYITLPQIIQPFALPAGGNNLKNRTVLAFWAGRCSSDIRDELIQSWQNDTELDIQNKRVDIRNTKGRIVYQEKFLRSRFCICPGAPHVHGARIAEAIHYGCVPVILSDYSVLPLNDILDWRKFSVVIKEKDVHQLKNILKNITDEKYRSLQNHAIKIQKHFQWNSPSVKLDTFRMMMYELWLRRHVVKYEQVDRGTHSTSSSRKMNRFTL